MVVKNKEIKEYISQPFPCLLAVTWLDLLKENDKKKKDVTAPSFHLLLLL